MRDYKWAKGVDYFNTDPFKGRFNPNSKNYNPPSYVKTSSNFNYGSSSASIARNLPNRR
jgi:hypothetical protein